MLKLYKTLFYTLVICAVVSFISLLALVLKTNIGYIRKYGFFKFLLLGKSSLLPFYYDGSLILVIVLSIFWFASCMLAFLIYRSKL